MQIDWLTNTFRAGDPLRKVSNARQANRLANIWNDITGIGCRIDKPINAEGRGWHIIVDGSSDITPPAGVVTVDRKFAVDTSDIPGTWATKVMGKDTAGSLYDTVTSPLVRWESVSDGGVERVRLFIDAANTITPKYLLGRDSLGSLGWVELGVCDS